MLVRDAMTPDPITAAVDTSLPELIDLMVEHDVSGLPVLDLGGRLVGVVTEADLVAHQAYPNSTRPRLTALGDLLRGHRNRWWQKAAGLAAGDIMTSPAHTSSMDEPLHTAAARMLTLGVKRLPVVDRDGELVGIISRRDLLRLFHRTDAALTSDVQALLTDPLRTPDEHGVTLTCVANGVAYLAGWTHTPADADAIETAVRHVPGIIDVRAGIGHRDDPHGAEQST